jgi:hypothetical protein
MSSIDAVSESPRASVLHAYTGHYALMAAPHQQEASGPDGPTWLLAGEAEARPRGRQADQRPVESSANPQASRTSRTKRKDKP